MTDPYAQLRSSMLRMRDQAFDYGTFMKRHMAAEGEFKEKEPPPISEAALSMLEKQIYEAFSANEIRYRSHSEFKDYFAGNIEKCPDGALFGGPTAASLNWTYRVIFIWLDELLIVANDLPKSSQPSPTVEEHKSGLKRTWWRNAAIISALIAGAFTLMAAAVTVLFS